MKYVVKVAVNHVKEIIDVIFVKDTDALNVKRKLTIEHVLIVKIERLLMKNGIVKNMAHQIAIIAIITLNSMNKNHQISQTEVGDICR